MLREWINKTNRIRKVMVVLAAMLATGLSAVCAWGATEFPDKTRKGSIEIEYTFDEGMEPKGGNEVQVYQIAKMVVDNGFKFETVVDGLHSEDKYYYTERVSEDNSQGVHLTLDDAAEAADFVTANGVAHTDFTVPEAADGAKFPVLKITSINPASSSGDSALELGVYLVVETKPADGYTKRPPFFFTMPIEGEDGKYIYDVEAIAKPIKPEEIGSTTPEACPQISKTINITGSDDETTRAAAQTALNNMSFNFLVEWNSGDPAPVNDNETVSGTSKTVTVTGQGTAEIGKITFTKAGTFTYKVSEVNTGLTNITYDQNSYYLTYTVEPNADYTQLVVTNSEIRVGDQNGEVYTGTSLPFTNSFYIPPPETETDSTPNRETSISPSIKTPTPSGTTTTPKKASPTPRRSTTVTRRTSVTRVNRLPQTGQLWWPIWVLVPAGIVMVLLGWYFRKGKRTE